MLGEELELVVGGVGIPGASDLRELDKLVPAQSVELPSGCGFDETDVLGFFVVHVVGAV